MKPTHEMELSCEQTIRSRGVCEPALEPRGEWEGSRTRGQDFKPDLGNSAVRHYRGAFENVAMVEMRTQLAIERAGLVTLHLQLARRSSIPTKIGSMSVIACSIKGDVKNILLPSPEARVWFATSSPCHHGRRYLGSCPGFGSALFHLSGSIFWSRRRQSVSETKQAVRLYGVNHGSI